MREREREREQAQREQTDKRATSGGTNIKAHLDEKIFSSFACNTLSSEIGFFFQKGLLFPVIPREKGYVAFIFRNFANLGERLSYKGDSAKTPVLIIVQNLISEI